ncbi:glucosaminidase domain-containing protein [Psychroserpens ponticola]|uniref:Peptidoglycan hydrolase n=1 Tax=Psychroserpens ponticola TaxID=2932268 RepID=A0ABY7S2R6_9FLAO|nr:glucosaminidase domain-containing protein [Psychroserpens ponticola]WCO02205.1 glucosaminidase domain-containing protein [Psychroserpens ponticola]
MKRISIIFLMSLVVVSCSSKRKIVTKKKDNRQKTEKVSKPTSTVEPSTPNVPAKPTTYANAIEAYIANFSAIAKEEMRKYKIPASITLAQGILESGSGKGRLAVKANNHFGIKCHGWTGQKIYHDDDASQECFRKYEHAESSFEDHSAFLTTRGRYSKLFQLNEGDYKRWAKGLRAAGYATDRKYPEKLISLIERYQLYKFDNEVLGRAEVIRTNDKKSEFNHTVVKGDTLYSLSRTYNTSVDKLKLLNNLSDNELSIGQVLIIK